MREGKQGLRVSADTVETREREAGGREKGNR